MKQYLRHFSSKKSDHGFTVLELLVSSALGIIILSIGLSAFVSKREIIDYDLDRTEVQRSIRSALEIIGMNIRLTGENLTSNFPALEVIDGTAGAPDQLILRRNLLDEILKLCQNVNNSSTDIFYFGIPGTNPGCIYADQVQSYAAWNAHFGDVGSPAQAYIYDPGTDTGQFFDFTSVTDSSTNMYLDISAGTPWTADYFVGQAAAYILEEWRFQLNGDVLELIENGDTGNPLQIAYGLTDFQVTVRDQASNDYTTFDSSNDWTNIQYVELTFTGNKARPDGALTRSLSAKFFPRNILSN